MAEIQYDFRVVGARPVARALRSVERHARRFNERLELADCLIPRWRLALRMLVLA